MAVRGVDIFLLVFRDLDCLKNKKLISSLKYAFIFSFLVSFNF
jgi:hypothetical protein